MRPLGRVVIVLFAVACLAACTEVVNFVVDTRYGQYNLSTDWAKNEAILLNVVRASEFQPLNFFSFQPYTGTATVSGSASAPSFIIGPSRVASQKQYTIGSSTLAASAMGTGTINVTSLDTYDFYDFLLSPVDFTNLNAFQRQGYPREFLFRLFTDYVSLKPVNGDRRNAFILYNEGPDDKRCIDLPPDVVKGLYGNAAEDWQRGICFEDLVFFALMSGLSSEVRTVASASSGGAAQAPAAAAGAAKTQSPSGSSSPPKPHTEGRLCFDPALSNREIELYKRQNPNDPRITLQRLNAVSVAEYHPICGGTTGLDKWVETPTTPAAAPVKPKPAVPAPVPGVTTSGTRRRSRGAGTGRKGTRHQVFARC